MAATYEQLIAKARELDAAGDIEGAKRLARIAVSRRDQGAAAPAEHMSAPSSQDTNVVEQGANGVNEGLARLMGFPVDAATGAINAGISGINNLAGTEISKIEDPFLGSNTFEKGLRGVNAITDAEPQTGLQRYARRIGQEVGFGAPIGLGAGVAYGGSALGRLMLNNAMADTAAGTAGLTAREIAPNSAFADILASTIAGGGTAALRGAMMKSRPDAPYSSTDEMFEAGDRRYKSAEDSGVALSQEAQEELFDRLYGRLKAERATPRRHPRAFDVVEDARNWPNARPTDIEETRAIIGRDVASNKDEAAVGVALKQEIEDFLGGLDASKTAGKAPESAIADLRAGRKLTHQAHKARQVEGKEYRAQSRAASGGTGGNAVNTMRQNVRSILDNEVAPARSGTRSGYTPDEIAQMEKIVFGTPGQNRLRWASRMAPSAGVMQSTTLGGGGLASAAVALATGNPLVAMGVVPGIAAEGARRLAEQGTRRDIDELLDIIRRGGVSVPRTVSPTGRAVQASGALSGLDGLTRH